MTDQPLPPPPPSAAAPPPPQWGQAPPQQKRGGCGKVVLIAFAVIGALVVIGIIVAIVGASTSTTKNDNAVKNAGKQTGIQSNSLNGSHPPQADINTSATKCQPDDAGFAGAIGTLTNHSSKASDYSLTITFKDAAGTQFADGNAFVQNVAPSGTASWDASSLKNPPAGNWTCTVAQVDRLASAP